MLSASTTVTCQSLNPLSRTEMLASPPESSTPVLSTGAANTTVSYKYSMDLLPGLLLFEGKPCSKEERAAEPVLLVADDTTVNLAVASSRLTSVTVELTTTVV